MTMRVLLVAVGLLVAAAALVPAKSLEVTTACLQAQTISVLWQIVKLQQELISTLQAETTQLQAETNSQSDSSSYSQLWPLQQVYDEVGTDSVREVPPARPSGRSCVSGSTLACTIQPGPDHVCRGMIGPSVKLWICSNGQWILVPDGRR